MLYVYSASGNFRMAVLETSELDLLKAGGPLQLPDGTTLCWTPDVEWIRDETKKAGQGGGGELIDIIRQSQLRPQAPPREPHEPQAFVLSQGKKPDEPSDHV